MAQHAKLTRGRSNSICMAPSVSVKPFNDEDLANTLYGTTHENTPYKFEEVSAWPTQTWQYRKRSCDATET